MEQLEHFQKFFNNITKPKAATPALAPAHFTISSLDDLTVTGDKVLCHTRIGPLFVPLSDIKVKPISQKKCW